MTNSHGDTTTLYELHPVTPPIISSTTKTISKFSGNALYWILQIIYLFLSLSFNAVCNPIVWFIVKTVFNVLTEVFVYMVLGVCSFVISVITHLDDYYTKGKRPQNKNVNKRSSRKFLISTIGN
ncbi:hypothetical protein ABEB36_002519 [Hypothenemus hampei]|uniref:Uncharacterized protein n=1 Tax=Hypothenemus hampei TaxID=57062 RepID=A0ABD1F613_HYPHA